MKLKLVVVHWIDSCRYDEDFIYDKNHPDLKPCKVVSVGHFMKETKDSITIGMNRWTGGYYDPPLTIVKTGITKIEYLKT